MPELSSPWRIRDVEIPSRIVLAPMAGVSVQAFRRQGGRFGAGLVCSVMVSSFGLSHRNERTLGYLRIARDEHPLAVQIFGAEPDRMAEAAQMVVAAGADIVDINFGCPVRKVTKTGAGASALEDQELAVELAGAVVDAVDVPVTVKMRRGLRNGSRSALDLGPRLEARGVASLTLHPRSAQQMYTGSADHDLTRELVERVSIPVIASGDITSRDRAQRVLDDTGAAAVMVGRGAQGRPWALREVADGGRQEPSWWPSWCGSCARWCARWARSGRSGSCASSTAGICAGRRGRRSCAARSRRRPALSWPRRCCWMTAPRRCRCWPRPSASWRCCPSPTATACSTCRSRSTAVASRPRAVVLVEGESDRCAVEALAGRRGRDLAAERVAVVPIGGAQAIGRVLRRYGPAGLDLRLAGIC